MASASWKTTGLPKCEPHNISEKVLVTYIPSWNPNIRIIAMAVYIPEHWCTDEDLGWNIGERKYDYEYNAEQDSYWIPGGWYETVENLIYDIGYIAIDGEVTAWDRLPKPYKEKIMDFSKIGSDVE